MENAELICAKALPSGSVHSVYELHSNFIEMLHEPICQSMGSFCGSNKKESVQDLKRHSTFLASSRMV